MERAMPLRSLIISSLLLVFFGSPALSQDTSPIKPDVVMKCYDGNVRAAKCTVTCGQLQHLGSDGKGATDMVNFSNVVDTVEMVTHGRASSAGYDRFWIFVTYKGGVALNTTSVFIGATHSCWFVTKAVGAGAPPTTTELRIETFNH
jgi:hypothetical protein